MRYLFALLFSGIALIANGQYYYNDILSTELTNKQFLLIQNNNIKSMKAFSFDADETQTEGFSLEMEINKQQQQIVTKSSVNNTPSLLTSIYKNNLLHKTINNAARVETTTTYEYNTKGLLQKLTTLTVDTFMNSILTEEHLWLYDLNNKIKAMKRVKNGTDTTHIEFDYDEFGNIGEENWKKNGRVVETYYYYYNAKNQLTDIVRFNSRAKRLLPDYLFEYDSTGKVSSMTQVSTGSSSYVIFQYYYNEKGMKEKELILNKLKQPVARIEYGYRLF